MPEGMPRVSAMIESLGTSSQQPIVTLSRGSQRDESTIRLAGLAEIRHVRDVLTRIIKAAEQLGPDAETTAAYYKK